MHDRNMEDRTMDSIECFMIERTDLFREELRRYHGGESGKCPAHPLGYHNADLVICQARAAPKEQRGGGRRDDFPHDDPRWPTRCDRCGYQFTPTDEWQHNLLALYRCPGGTLVTLNDAPIGAMYYADWMRTPGPDGHSLAVVLPPDRHIWLIDARSSNCTRPKDKHYCWCRHGTPPNVTVDKTPEPGT
jgi:hypothetical protein